ncbi:MAG: KamA family radical SAM protein [Lentisphaeria bacterium]|nr:KamA family radical SAM protein [Lentisphaeria bacterium]
MNPVAEVLTGTREPVPLGPAVLSASDTDGSEPRRAGLRTRLRRGFSRRVVYRRRFFPAATARDWRDWHWHLANRIQSADRIRSMLSLAPDEEAYFAEMGARLPAGITPYYMSLLATSETQHPLRRCVIPTVHEHVQGPGESDDPLSEEGHSPVPGLVHRYPDRVLLLALDACSTYCRYCTRSRLVGHGCIRPSRERLETAFAYIRSHTAVRDVLVSGGDPLILENDVLDWILHQLRAIPHVEIIRIGTKTPAVLPQRITLNLLRVLRRYHPLWMSLHFTHPLECTAEAYRACSMLADAGIPLGSQTVLLRGINDSVDTMKALVHHLLRMRVRPYYLYQCDPISGSAHFRTTVEKGVEIIRGLRGYTSGYAVPTYVVDAPGGGGKIPLMPHYVLGHDGNELVLRNYEGREYRYPDPPPCPPEA